MTLPRQLAALTVAAALAAACSSSESSAPTTPAPATTEAAADESPATTAPPTTAASTTAPPTTAAPTTAPATTEPPTTEPPMPSAAELSSFCFESEQVYLAGSVISLILEPTPAQAQASLQFLLFTSQEAAAAAPEGMGEEANRFAEIVVELDGLFARYGYDVVALDANEDVADYEPLFAEFDTIVFDQLLPFLDEVCGTPTYLLDAQAFKLAPLIDVASTWPLVAITNELGDIRLLVPLDWNDAIGSDEFGEVTFLQATTDAEAFESTWDVPGVVVSVFYVESGAVDPATRVPGTAAAVDCGAPVSVEPYADPVYFGELHLFDGCAGTDTAAAVLVVTDEFESTEVVLEFQFPGGPDRDLLDQMLAGFVAGL